MNNKTIIGLSIVLFSIATISWLGYWLLGFAVGSTYHPNAIEGSWGLKYGWLFALLVLVNLIWLLSQVLRKTVPKKLKKVGIASAIFFVLVASFYFLRSVERNYNVTYYIENDVYSIPWEYNPINGSAEAGGTYFVVHVSYPGFVPQYAADDYYKNRLTISKSIEGSRIPVGSNLPNDCQEDVCVLMGTASIHYFIDDGFIYTIHYQGKTVLFTDLKQVDDLKESILILFDSFK